MRSGLLRFAARDMLHLLPRRYIISYYHRRKRSVKIGPLKTDLVKSCKGKTYPKIFMLCCAATASPRTHNISILDSDNGLLC